MGKTYITDIKHYLDEHGELAEMPPPTRKLASFLVLLIDATTQKSPVRDFDTRIRCKTDGCNGSIQSSLTWADEPIAWHCPDCENKKGVIRNWQGTKWDQTRAGH